MKEQYTIRIENIYLEKLKIIANKELRSLNNQIEYFLAKEIKEYEDNEYAEKRNSQ